MTTPTTAIGTQAIAPPTGDTGHLSQAGPDFAPRRIAETGDEFPCHKSEPADFGLALSGGGLRAMLFHLGALYRLREMGLLPKLDRISGVSGGSIMAALLAKGWTELAHAGFSEDAFERHVAEPTMAFAGRHLDVWVIGVGLIPGVRPAHRLAWAFRRWLTGDLKLADLPEHPRFIFNAANLSTGVSWVFQRAYMGDSRLGVVCKPDLRVADAVAASASFPPVVAPYWLDIPPDRLRKVEGADLFDDPAAASIRERVLLLDGGVYDNLGIEPIEGASRVVLASSAGGNLKVDDRRSRYRLSWPLIRRTLSIAIEVGRAQRRRALIDRATANRDLPPDAVFHSDRFRTEPYRTKHVALWRTSNDLTRNKDVPEAFPIVSGWNDYLASRKTRLWPMRELDRRRLVNWGYLTSDAMIRKYVPDLASDPDLNADPPTELPFDGVDFASPPPAD